jgi:hypothetical protein
VTPETTTAATQAGPAPGLVTTTFQQASLSDPRQPLSPDAAAKSRTDSWRSWIGIAGVVGIVAWFLWYKLPDFRGLDERRVGIILNKDFSLHYPALVAHVVTGTIALVTLCVQITPWVRRNYPTVHRISGRLYVFAGVLPCALLALLLNRLTAFWEGNTGTAVESVAWLGATAMGFLAARRRRWAQHRRWMTYSFAIALGFLWGAIAGAWFAHASKNAGHPVFNPAYLLEFVRWGGWIVNLAIAQWWLERTGWAPRSRTERTEQAPAAVS